MLGHYATGVAAITADVDGQPVGMACNSITSVSLEPPLISFCVATTSTTWPDLRRAGEFCVNILASHQEETCRTFARRGVDRFAGLDVHGRTSGPALTDALAWIDCVLYREYELGDHVLVVGLARDLGIGHGNDPLVFFRGQYGLASAACASAGR